MIQLPSLDFRPEEDRPRVLVADDDAGMRAVLQAALDDGAYEVLLARDGQEALDLFLASAADVVIADLFMPRLDGVGLLRRVREIDPDAGFVVLTGAGKTEHAIEALRLHANDYLRKPFHVDEVRHAVARALEHRQLVRENRRYRRYLERRVSEQAEQLSRITVDALLTITNAIEARDGYTGGHVERVTQYALATGRELRLDPDALRHLWMAGLLHDIGKIGVPDQVLTKAGRLSAREYEIIRRHPSIGAAIIASTRLLQPALPGVLHHHERWDGAGYPHGLRGAEIPLQGRILSVADAFDAMISARPYRSQRAPGWAVDELRRCAGSQFDPEVVEAFLRAWEAAGAGEDGAVSMDQPYPGVADGVDLVRSLELDAAGGGDGTLDLSDWDPAAPATARDAIAFEWHPRTDRLIWNDFVPRGVWQEAGELGRSLRDWADRLHPDDRAGVAGALAGAAESEGHVQLQFRLRDAAGGYGLAVLHATRILDAGEPWIVGAVERLGVRTAAPREAEERRAAWSSGPGDGEGAAAPEAIPDEWYRTVVDSLAEGVLITDSAGRIRSANPRAAEIVGVEADELVGRDVRSVLAPDHPDRWAEPWVRTLDTAAPLELELDRPGGEAVWVALEGRALPHLDHSPAAVLLSLKDISERKRSESALLEAALQDPLTRLPNRALLVERIAHAIARARRHAEHQFAILFLDIDHLKTVNDSLGHEAGDELLRTAAERLQRCLRPEDTVARFGGDEFAILLEGVAGLTDATRVAQRIQEELASPILLGGYAFSSSASIGIVLSAPTYEEPEQLLRNADVAMYRAKTRGRGRYEIFDREMHAQVTARLQAESDLRRALERDELVLHYQPVVDLESREVVGHEALLRWRHPRRGLLLPDQFLALADDTGLMIPFGAWVLERACRQLREWNQARAAESEPLWMAVNLSAKQFLQPGLPDQVAEALRATGVEPELLRLEVQEGVVSRADLVALQTLERLREIGVRVAIDDFGTGYISLANLQRLPIAMIKIDRCFVEAMGEDPGRHMVRSILGLAGGLGVGVVAEGVGTEEQREELLRLGCRWGQGWLFGRAG